MFVNFSCLVSTGSIDPRASRQPKNRMSSYTLPSVHEKGLVGVWNGGVWNYIVESWFGPGLASWEVILIIWPKFVFREVVCIKKHYRIVVSAHFQKRDAVAQSNFRGYYLGQVCNFYVHKLGPDNNIWKWAIFNVPKYLFYSVLNINIILPKIGPIKAKSFHENILIFKTMLQPPNSPPPQKKKKCVF